MNQPVRGSTAPRTCSSKRKLWPCSRAHLWPVGTLGRRCAASKRYSLTNSTVMNLQEYHGARLTANAQHPQQPAEKPAFGMVEQTADTGFTGVCVPYAVPTNIAIVRTK